MKLNDREKRTFSIVLTIWAIFLIISGLIMNSQLKPEIQTTYSLNFEKRKIAEAQAKTNEIKLKEIEIEINTPLSVDVKDYLLDIENLNEDTIKSLKLDTSLVNINEAGSYSYKIIYQKKTYIGTIKIKEKELPNVTFTLKTIKLQTKETISSNPRSFINEEISDEVYNNITLDISNVDTSTQGDYTYYILYNGVTYQGKVEIRDPSPIVIIPKIEIEKKENVCPEGTTGENNTCIDEATTNNS